MFLLLYPLCEIFIDKVYMQLSVENPFIFKQHPSQFYVNVSICRICCIIRVTHVCTTVPEHKIMADNKHLIYALFLPIRCISSVTYAM